jgi:hypothetical protein
MPTDGRDPWPTDFVAQHQDLFARRHQRVRHLSRLQGHLVKEYFANYFLHMSDVTFDMNENRVVVYQRHAES